jgi:hypothetical protein
MNSGAACARLGEWERSLDFHRRAMAHADRRISTTASYNMSCTLLAMSRCRESIEVLDRALLEQPGNADMHWNKAIAHLLLGEFDRGWPEYEWRWQLEAHGAIPQLGLARWTGGQPLDGKRLLVFAEQGLGDSLQFMRYVPLLAQRGARVVLAVPAPLVAIAASMECCEVVANYDVRPSDDWMMCPLLSLPFAFGTTEATIPGSVPYLHSDAALRDVWAARLGPRTRPRIGLVWSGSPGHKNDANRSLALQQLLPLVSGDFEWISLQREVRDSDRTALASGLARDVSSHLQTFADTAALVDMLDLVISVDTSVAHLAGALGKPLWVLLPHSPDWRWQMDRNDSPWYPTARLFRQGTDRRWEPVIRRLTAALAELRLPAST